MVTENSSINLRQLLQEIHSLMSVRIIEQCLKFEMKLSPNLPVDIMVDVSKLRQILINLIENAVKYTDKGKILLHVHMIESEVSQMMRLRFEVEDSGVGISRENQETIFAPFSQIGDQPASESGTGLGLAICKQFIELMGGHIGVNSKVGKGSVFYFEVLVGSTDPSAPLTPVGIGDKRITGVEKGQQQYRLLIVEDKLENRLLLQSLLSPLGFELREAVNGQEAVEQFEQWHPHLIWMDIRMPVMNGLEATRQIKKSNTKTDTKIVALTAHALEEERLDILDAGCDDFIRKPYRDIDIYNALSKHLGIRFLYAEKDTPINRTNDFDLMQKELRELSLELIEDLREAIVLLDSNKCYDTIVKISTINHELGNSLNRLVSDMQYHELLEILDSLVLEDTR